MDQTARALPAGRGKPDLLVRLLTRAYTSNPFYVLSADLVFVGLRMSLDTSGKTFETHALMLSLLGYTLLLATTACLLIRLGGVWDDTRTLLLLVVTMFLAVSVTFDETLAGNPRLGKNLYLGGLLFAIAVSEGVLRSIRLRLPAVFRLPYYLILSLFFLYPVALTPLLGDPDRPAIQWAIFGFSPVAGVAFLSLLPAVRRGRLSVASNGSPWGYPVYPWVVFGLLGAAVCGRAYYLCISFHFVGKSDSIFGLYFLVPFLLAADLLLMEAGIVSRSVRVQVSSLVALPGLTFLSAMGHRVDPVYQGFLTTFMGALGASPLFLTLAAVVIVCVAAVRRLPFALEAMTCSLLVLSLAGRRTLDFGGLTTPQPLLLFAVAALQLGLALRLKASWRFLVGAIALTGAVAIGTDRVGWHGLQAVVAVHIMLAALMAVGVLFDDALSRFLAGVGAALLNLACLSALWTDPGYAELPPILVLAYPVVLGLVGIAYGHATGSRAYLVAGWAGILGWLAAVGWQGYGQLRRRLVGLDWIIVGLAFFGLAAVISLAKAGVWSSWNHPRKREGIDGPFAGPE